MKSLTEDFLLLRTNSIRRRRFQNEQVSYTHDDESRVSLLQEEEERVGLDQGSVPNYVGQSEALQYQMGRLEGKVSQLDVLHKRHLARPSFDEKSSEEAEIKALTREVSEMFSACHQQIKLIRRSTSKCLGPESIITQNLVNYFALRLQETSETFSKSQNSYLNRMKSREELGKNIFEFDDDEIGGADASDDGWTKPSLMALEDNTMLVRKREREIHKIVQSIAELNAIFKDLATMVSDQGTIIDRIDYNIEHAHMRVEEGLKSLKQAEKYQKQDKKMHCILILAVIFIILLFVLIITKT